MISLRAAFVYVFGPCPRVNYYIGPHGQTVPMINTHEHNPRPFPAKFDGRKTENNIIYGHYSADLWTRGHSAVLVRGTALAPWLSAKAATSSSPTTGNEWEKNILRVLHESDQCVFVEKAHVFSLFFPPVAPKCLKY